MFIGVSSAHAVNTAPTSEIAALIAGAQGTYPASQLPLICVAIHQSTATPAQNLALLQKIGAGCARSDIPWASIERFGSAGAYDWSVVDDLWSTLCQAKIKPIMIATYNNPLYAPDRFRPIAGGANIAAYKNFAVAIANHYSGICSGMAEELFNEPSASNWTTVPWSGTSYAMMLAPVSSAIKAAQPHVKVYSGGIGVDPHDPATWITQMVSAGRRFSAVDAYAMHPYFYETPSPGTPVPEQLLADASRFAHDSASTGQAKPIALTEYGFSVRLTGGDLTRQANYIARGMLAAIIGRYPVQTLYDLIDDGTDEKEEEQTYGLFRNGGFKTPFEMKPSAMAFSAITDAMAGAKSFTIAFDAALSAPTVSFDKAKSKVIIVWTYDATAQKMYAQPIGSFSQVICKDIMGKPYPCHYADGTLSISLSEAIGPIVATALK